MRRNDREMDSNFAKQVIDRSRFGVLSMIDATSDSAYSVPLSIVRDGDLLYFHSAKEGRKVELITQNKKVRVVFVGDVKVPNLFTDEQLDEIAQNQDTVKLLLSSVFTTEYESASVEGSIFEVEDVEEKKKALKLICEKYTPDKMKYFEHAVQSGEKYTNIYRIQMELITGKRKKYDDEGNEMKWGRL